MKKVAWVFVFVVLVGMVCVEGSWGDINEGDDLSDDIIDDSVVVQDNFSDDFVGDFVRDDSLTDDGVLGSSGEGEKWTNDFYIALGVGSLGLLIVGLFIYLFLRSPKDKWKK